VWSSYNINFPRSSSHAHNTHHTMAIASSRLCYICRLRIYRL